ncbi:hypothetical protein [Streptomyces triculaminicus]|uniref:hypothetical protein n=1 Tax=Streptomyces triculaminicus TaxID=2816232 RepID=UPI0037A80DB3
MGAAKAARAASKKAAPTRQAARVQGAAARRAVADTRRAAAAGRTAARLTHKGRAGRALAKGLLRAARARDGAVAKARAARDQRSDKAVAAKRVALRKASARQRARSALWRSAARFHTRRALAGLLALPLGVLGLMLTPLGRKLNWIWLQNLGLRLYRRIVGAARAERAERDKAIRTDLADEEAAIDTAADDEIGDTAERPDHLVPITTPSLVDEGENVSGFRFEEHTAEMEVAAGSYDPDGCMEILAMVENLPEALTSIANTMRVLAERSDSEFPLEKEVADGFEEIYKAVLTAVGTAEDLGPTFRRVHEHDIARHEDPRNGPEAEKGWNV